MPENFEFLPGSQETEIMNFISEFHSGNLPFLFQTSGSTGKPKKIIFTKDQLIVSAKNTIAYFQLHENQTFYLCLDVQTVAAKMMIVRAIISGARLICGPVKKEIQLPPQRSIDFVALVPIQLQHLLTQNLHISTQTIFLLGGAPLSQKIINLILTKEIQCYQSFGMTETLSHVALRKITKHTMPYSGMEGITFTSEQGKLIIHYPALSQNPIRTTDEIELIDERNFYWKGRQDFAINSGGVKLHPFSIEDKILENLGLQTLIFGQPDEFLGEKVVMLVIGNIDVRLKKSNFSFLSPYEIPKLYQCIPRFHYLRNEKIDRINTKLASKENEWRALL
jgi:O-succinylbenzoic acid--CoA ligase